MPSAVSEPGKRELALEQLQRLGVAALWLGGVFGGSAIAAAFVAERLQAGIPSSDLGFLLWGTVVSFIHFLFFRLQAYDQRGTAPAEATTTGDEQQAQHDPWLPWFQRDGQIICLAVGALLAVIFGVLPGSAPMSAPLSADFSSTIRLASILYLGMSFALYFLVQYVAFVQQQQNTRKLDAPLHLARLGFWICLICAACLFMSLYAGLDLTLWPGRAIGMATLLFVVDASIRAGVAVFQTRAKSLDPIPLGGGLVLEVLFRGGNPWRAFVQHVETSLGVKVSEHWLSRFLRETIEPLILVAIILVWLSTCFTAVPTESHGVRVYWGRFVEPALEPGLYVTWPWPAEKIEIVPTERVEQFSLGFEYDLGGPALWTEVHYEGEKNLLVGNGEELLSISVPIYYRIKDPITYLKTITDAREALISLAYRQLLRVTEARDSFRVMTVERQEISRALKQSLQDEIDRLHLGLEIVFVGLKDIHPPVAVAPAFQDVVSAEEQKSALIYQAGAYRLQTVAEAKQQAYRLQTEAEAALAQRTALAEGEAARFLLLATEDAAERNLFRIRFRLEALEKALAIPDKVLITGPAATKNQFYLDLRSLDTPSP